MEGKHIFTNISSARIVASTFGVLAGLGGLTHGVGEMLTPFLPGLMCGQVRTM